MIEINRYTNEYDDDGRPIVNPEFAAILDTPRTGHSPLLCCSGKYDGCREYEGKVYEVWVNWGFACVFELQADDLNNTHQDPEGRRGEEYKVDQCRTDRELIAMN